MKTLREYQLCQNFEVAVVQGDARDISADVCVTGRARQLMAELSASNQLQLVAPDHPFSLTRKVELYRCRTLPWKNLIRIDYHPGPKSPFTFAPNTMPHALKLAWDLQLLIYSIGHFLHAETVIILPLSAWNRDTVCASTVEGLRLLAPHPESRTFDQSMRILLVDLVDPSPYCRWFDEKKLFKIWEEKLEEYWAKR